MGYTRSGSGWLRGAWAALAAAMRPGPGPTGAGRRITNRTRRATSVARCTTGEYITKMKAGRRGRGVLAPGSVHVA